ncbi:alcohol dehydrogenase catalytic domain-containing protein [Propionivibrio sp.]|jgi:2-desacetyl-2-hydroxyethyl bacteriochlorophyllide A dehydrogenase|uniref:alcohol dehydrogenase catalytic domain-containing protein n=1 Tax=Propionivibrio sp. TaxID=2212460 RepID=UPI0039E53A2A
MKTVCLKQPGDISLVDVPEQRREPEQVLIKVRSAGICGSDIGAYKGVNPLVSYPRVIGHEIAGEVVEVADDEQEFKVGDRVILEPYVYCGKCYPCSIGHTNCCENLTVRGVHIEGGMAEYVSHPRHLLHKVPAGIPWHLVPMAEPLVIAMHAVQQAEVAAGQHVVVTGAGQIGLLAAQYALTLGAVPIVVDPVDERLALARSLGVAHTVNPAGADAVAGILSITGGRMAEAVIECSGDARAIRGAVDYVSYAGHIALVGWPKGDIPMPTALFTKKELTVRGSRNSVGQFPESLRLIAEGKVNVEALLTKTVSMDETPAIVADIAAHPEKYLKVTCVL